MFERNGGVRDDSMQLSHRHEVMHTNEYDRLLQ